jgi:hypothetical protein
VCFPLCLKRAEHQLLSGHIVPKSLDIVRVCALFRRLESLRFRRKLCRDAACSDARLHDAPVPGRSLITRPVEVCTRRAHVGRVAGERARLALFQFAFVAGRLEPWASAIAGNPSFTSQAWAVRARSALPNRVTQQLASDGSRIAGAGRIASWPADLRNWCFRKARCEVCPWPHWTIAGGA